jgi:hypothetical protein
MFNKLNCKKMNTIIKNIKHLRNALKICACCLFVALSVACRDYLNIVPDNTQTLEDFFLNREIATTALAKVYSYLPNIHEINNTPFLLGDDYIDCLDNQNRDADVNGIRIMRGKQNSEHPLLNFWEGGNGGRPMYQAIRAANIFLENVESVPDLSAREKADWIAQVKFLKAYYHFVLLQYYGPIIIQDVSLPLDALSEDLFQYRSKIEVCFDYIIKTIDEAIPNLKERASENDLGQVDRGAALAMKARIMLYRASPFYNGNSEFYGNFLDRDGQPFFPMQYSAEKWVDALAAVEEAITFCEANGWKLYEFQNNPYIQDLEDFELNHDAVKTLYDLRMLIVDSWNNEIVWARNHVPTADASLQTGSNIRLPAEYTNGVTETTGYSWNWLGCTFGMMERYYTKNGLPVNDDITFDKNTMYDLYKTPGITDTLEYLPFRGIIQPGAQLVRLYLDREMRFYANLGITGGYWRSHQERIPTMMLGGTAGGYSSAQQRDWLWTGIGVQKYVHPESKSGNWTRQIRFGYPFIRMADLYLMKAEILNEIQGPGEAVWTEINKIRRRAGIPDVETVWSDPALLGVGSSSIDRHKNKDGMCDIILRERSIEFAFEGSRFWDMLRYKRAVTEFNSPVVGWKGNAYGAAMFFELESKQTRRFLARDYLWPLSTNELNTNAHLIQNPGW